MAATITRKLVSLTDAADILAVSTKTVRRYIADGHLEAVRLGRKTLRIKLDSIERFIDARPVGGFDRLNHRGRASA
jgi:excisionase family DNA binding protein